VLKYKNHSICKHGGGKKEVKSYFFTSEINEKFVSRYRQLVELKNIGNAFEGKSDFFGRNFVEDGMDSLTSVISNNRKYTKYLS
jgi:hypothetical protein